MIYLGIDVSKTKLDCALLDPLTDKRKSKIVANSKDGYSTLLDWLNAEQVTDVHVIIEPTGGYQERAALALVAAGLRLSLANPLRVRRYAQGLGVLSKTDKADSVILARYGSEQKLAPWRPPSRPVRQLQDMLRRQAAMDKELQREKNRAMMAADVETAASVKQSIQRSLAFLAKEVECLECEIKHHIECDPAMREKRNLLLSIPAVGDKIANQITALLSAYDFQRAEQMAAYLGLVPVLWESGTSVHKRPNLSKAGPSYIRKLLFLPAIVATRCNPHIKALYERMLKRGKSKMSAIGAAMHKLVHLCFGVVKWRKPYDPNWQAVSSKTVHAQTASPRTPFHLCLMSDE